MVVARLDILHDKAKETRFARQRGEVPSGSSKRMVDMVGADRLGARHGSSMSTRNSSGSHRYAREGSDRKNKP